MPKYIQTHRDELSTYDMTSGGDILKALFVTGLPIALFVGAWLSENMGTVQWIMIAFSIGLVPWAVGSWATWFMRNHAETMRRIKESQIISAELMAMDYHIQAQRNDIELARAIAVLNPEQIEYAKAMTELPSVLIDGPRVAFMIDGMQVPLDFVRKWYKKYTARGGNELPGDGDWGDCHPRERYRMYNEAFMAKLMRMGAVIPAASKFPPRWTKEYSSERMRIMALGRCGLWYALSHAEAMPEHLVTWTTDEAKESET